MRLLTTLLFLAVPILGVWSFWIADSYGWWFPENVSTYGDKTDSLFNMITYMVGITFVLTEVCLGWFIFRYSRKGQTKAVFSHGNHKLEMVWTAIPALMLLLVAFSQMSIWAEIKFSTGFPDDNGYSVEEPLAEVYASQFDWRVRYPDEDGNFNGADIVETPFEFVVPVDTNVVFHLKSRDVLHSFFVPMFRLKQDAVPGMTIPVWFNAREVGEYELICAELCGWGHYKMAGMVKVLEQADYKEWLETKRQELYANGSEELLADGDDGYEEDYE